MGKITQNGLIVRISRVEAVLLNVQGILDIADTKLNGADTNVMLEINEDTGKR